MPRQRKPYRREAHVFPEDFPQKLERLKEESGLTWSELARRLDTNPLTLRRWRQGARPSNLPRRGRTTRRQRCRRDGRSGSAANTGSDVLGATRATPPSVPTA